MWPVGSARSRRAGLGRRGGRGHTRSGRGPLAARVLETEVEVRPGRGTQEGDLSENCRRWSHLLGQ